MSCSMVDALQRPSQDELQSLVRQQLLRGKEDLEGQMSAESYQGGCGAACRGQ